jgi:carbamoyltransferase
VTLLSIGDILKVTMNYIGISAGFHDAAISIVDDQGNILFAGHSERYSKNKHDKNVCKDLLTDALKHTNSSYLEYHYYERPWLKSLRQLRSGEGFTWPTWDKILGSTYSQMSKPKIHTHGHHLCHAAAGFQTSPFDDATVVVIDAIGELDTITIWHAEYNAGRAKYKNLWSQSYPHSIGLFYSAMTQRVGLRPLDEEYILMGMAAYGKSKPVDNMSAKLIKSYRDITFRDNLHIGVSDTFLEGADEMDIACSTQLIAEQLIMNVISKAKMLGGSKNLVYGGGVALNCLANRLLGDYYDNIWIMPNPGDAGSSLGAAAVGQGGKIIWTDAFLGYNIVGPYPVDALIRELHDNKIVGVASGRAEFGPRALGNRSLLADPRGPAIKDTVNEIKRRQKFRPFAPVILEELADMYFDMPAGWSDSRYMQSIARCRHPQLFPAIVHADGTSRVQTVPKDNSGIRKLLEKWYALTGCPMLLNTSLNIRGEPMVNDRSDADRFQSLYGIKVLS